MKIKLRYKGGKGSGFEGHAGRPGKVGGSASGSGGGSASGSGGGSWKSSNKISNKLPKDYKGSVKITTHYSGMNNFVTSNSGTIIIPHTSVNEFFTNSLKKHPNDAYWVAEPYQPTPDEKRRAQELRDAEERYARYNKA